MMGRIDSLSVIAGIVMTIGGIGLLVVSIFVPFLIVYAILMLILGLVILFTLREQEHVEPLRKTKKHKRVSK